MSPLVRFSRVPRFRRVALVAAAVGTLVSVVMATAPASSTARVDRATLQPQSATTTTLFARPGVGPDPGRIAYVTPAGDVVVADGDGSNAVTVGSGAVSNDRGLAPLAWRQPAADAITYVREDGALVIAPVDGSPERIIATDAVVPPDADETIVSWDFSGSFLIYLAEPAPGRVEARVIDLTTADDDTPPEIRVIGNPDRRRVLAQAFSPLDPIIYQKTVDPDTGRQFTVSIVEPTKGTVYGSNFSFDDVTFSPDGRYAFAVSGGNGNVEQMVRLTVRNPKGVDLVTDHDRVCNPAVSPDSRLVVFAAGERCQEVWTIRTNGTEPKRIAKQVGGTATFDIGQFTWSQDGKTITHAACKRIGEESACDGGYWDISVDGRDVRPRAVAGSVLREQRPLLRPIKVRIDITGPVEYSGQIQVGTGSSETPFANTPDEKIQYKGVDENDSSRSFEVKAIHPVNSVWLAGTVRIVDSGFDETFPFVGRVLPFSLGYARLRGIWTRSEKLPIQSGSIVVTVER
ncbi:MAG TPA: hypothetical protein PLV93_00570 [Microthrixaceae bacterium]|nr:hypothetical protein [Microthrixaceae bacterium]HNI33855.1 hypothetical protein [Microthrixaceae bacterium]